MSLLPSSADLAQTVVGTANNNTAVASGTVSGASTVRSDWVACSGASNVSFDVNWSGGASSPAGTFTVEGSNLDTPPATSVACGLIPMAATPAALTGNSGNAIVETIRTAARWARLVTTVTAGSFTLGVVAFPKRLPT